MQLGRKLTDAEKAIVKEGHAAGARAGKFTPCPYRDEISRGLWLMGYKHARTLSPRHKPKPEPDWHQTFYDEHNQTVRESFDRQAEKRTFDDGMTSVYAHSAGLPGLGKKR
jgi:ribosome modulation factor